MPQTSVASVTAEALLRAFGSTHFTYQDALTVVTPQSLRTAVARGQVTKHFRGYFSVTAADASELARYRMAAAASLESRPQCVASHETALAMHGMYSPHFRTQWESLAVRLTTSANVRLRTPRLTVTSRPLPPDHVVQTAWGPATSPLRTAADLARSLPPERAIIIADQACRLHLAVEGDDAWDARVRIAQERDRAVLALIDVLREVPIRKGQAAALEVARFANPAAESPGESLSRWYIHQAGLPAPQINVPIRGAFDELFYPDMLWEDARLIGEIDGWIKYSADPQGTFRLEKRRADSLANAGYRIVRWDIASMLSLPMRNSILATLRRELGATNL